ncbi:hypothetical protein pipiens_010358 [Culex pipiens pipiens]|uniref:Uncharacterized protein n=1 Tax=Culex pipiens pipiens TaxID=38569 RepID=A0ABD1DAU1_CULPP
MPEIHSRKATKDEEEGVIFIQHTVGADRVCDYAAVKSPLQITACSGRSSVVEGRCDEFDYEVARAGLFPEDSTGSVSDSHKQPKRVALKDGKMDEEQCLPKKGRCLCRLRSVGTVRDCAPAVGTGGSWDKLSTVGCCGKTT